MLHRAFPPGWTSELLSGISAENSNFISINFMALFYYGCFVCLRTELNTEELAGNETHFPTQFRFSDFVILSAENSHKSFHCAAMWVKYGLISTLPSYISSRHLLQPCVWSPNDKRNLEPGLNIGSRLSRLFRCQSSGRFPENPRQKCVCY